MQNLLPLQKQELQQSFVVWHMVYQNISNLLGKASEISDRFAARELVEVNDGRWHNYDSDLIEIKTSILQSRLCDSV